MAYCINEDTRRRIRAMLWRVGTLVKTPRAMSLVSPNTSFPFRSSWHSGLAQATMPYEKIEYAEIVAGLLLVRSNVFTYPFS